MHRRHPRSPACRDRALPDTTYDYADQSNNGPSHLWGGPNYMRDMMNIHDLSDDKLANYLAYHLSDLEFELLVRERIRTKFVHQHTLWPGLAEHHNACAFRYKWEDASEWTITVGSTYRDEVTVKGEVLSMTVHNAADQYARQHGNKLSLLLPPPAPEFNSADMDEMSLKQVDSTDDMPF